MEDMESGKTPKEADKSPNEYEYTDVDLDEMGETLLRAKKIQADTTLYSMVMEHMNGKVKEINSLDDLRARQKEVELRDSDMDDAYNGDDPYKMKDKK